MSPETQLAETLKQLLQREPDLIHELQGVQSPEEAVGKMAAAAERRGVSLDEHQRATLAAEIARRSWLATAVGDLIRDDGALAETLQAGGEPDQAVQAIMDAAARRGLSFDAGELSAYVQQVFDLKAPKELSDEELSEVSGGDLGIAAGLIAMGLTAIIGVGGATLTILGGFGLLSKKGGR